MSAAKEVSVLIEPGTPKMYQVLQHSLGTLDGRDIWSLTLAEIRTICERAYSTRKTPDDLNTITYAMSCLTRLGDEAVFRGLQ